MYQNIAGIGLVILASTLSSIGMNFQKLAHRQTDYHDPRTMQKVRKEKLTSDVYCRPYMLLGFVLSISATVLDSMALLFIGTTTIGILGCSAIPINVFVSRLILYERIGTSEKWYILLITLGCIACLITNKTHETLETFERFAKTETAVFIICMWSLAMLLYMLCHFIERVQFQLPALSIISGIMGAQFVTMGKYLLDMIWLIEFNYSLPPLLQIIGVAGLAIMAVTFQVIFLNKALEKFNATHAVAIFQCTWCVLNVTQGIVIFGDMESATTVEYIIFMSGFLAAITGVVALSRQIGVEPPSYSDHNPSSTSL